MQNKINKFSRGVEVVCGGIVEDSQGRILLVRSPKWSNKWTFPGGHIKPGETIKEAVIREIQEEVKLPVEFIRIINHGELINPTDFYRPVHFIYFDVYCKIKDEDQKVQVDGKEVSEHQWLEPHEALKLDLAQSYSHSIKVYLQSKK